MNARSARPRRRVIPLDLGPLPADKVNRVLGSNLAAAVVHFSARAQIHARNRHPAEFAICLRNVQRIVAAPEYVGKGPGRTDGFELVGEAHQDQAIVLVAIKLLPDKSGRFIVASTYVIDRDKLARRIRKGFLTQV